MRRHAGAPALALAWRALAPALLTTVLSGCSLHRIVACHDGESRAVMDSLYFGTLRENGQVSLEEWQDFLGEVITPRFPDGLTSWAAAGQWRDGEGAVQKESAYVLHVVHADSPKHDKAVREVIGLYKERFDQRAVLRVRSPACISF